MKRPVPHHKEPAAQPSPPGSRHGRDRAAGFWIYGSHAVLAAVANPRRRCRRLLAVAEAARLLDARGRAGGAAHPTLEIVGRRILDEIVGADARHQGVAVLVEPLPATPLEAVLTSGPSGPLVVLDQVTDPRNVGAVLRAAAAFSAAAVAVQDRHAPAETGAMAKAASGALETVPLVRVVNIARTLRALQDAGLRAIGFTADAPQALAEIDAAPPLVLVLGSEGAGLRRLVREQCDLLARIPIAPAVESLNVATAAAIALYACASHRA